MLCHHTPFFFVIPKVWQETLFTFIDVKAPMDPTLGLQLSNPAKDGSQTSVQGFTGNPG